MATVIDAFVATLGLDAAKFNKERVKVKQGLRDTSTEAGKAAKEMEEKGKQAAQFFSSIKTEALSLLAVLTAGAGLKAFVSDSIKSSAETGRLAKNLDMATEQLSAWEGAATRSGGTADSMAATFRNVSGELAKFKMGLSSDFVAWFARAGGDFTKLKNANVTMMELSRIISDLDKKDPGKALLVAKNLGVDEATFNFLRQGPKYVQAQLEAQKRLGVVTDADAKRAQAMQAKLEALREASAKLGRDLLTKAAPAIEWLTEKLSDLAVMAQDHGPMVAGFFTAIAIAIAAPMAELILITAAIAAVAVAIGYVYEQWIKWMNGSESSLGAFFQFFADTWAKIQAIGGGTFAAIGAAMSAWWDTTKATLNLLRALFFGSGDEIREAWKTWLGSVGMYFEKLADVAANILPLIGKGLIASFSAAFDWIENRAHAVWDAITGKHSPKPVVVAPAVATTASGPVVPATGTARGDRNNNPGNLNFARQNGAHLESGPGARFAAFDTMAEGVAALAVQLKLYASRGIDTISSIVKKYAPAADNNNVGAYIAALTKATGKGADDKLDLNDTGTLSALMKGIVKHEGNTVPDDQITAGARLVSRTNTTNRGGDTNTSEVKIGKIEVHTPATDAAGIARDAQAAFRSYPMIAPQANTGLN